MKTGNTMSWGQLYSINGSTKKDDHCMGTHSIHWCAHTHKIVLVYVHTHTPTHAHTTCAHTHSHKHACIHPHTGYAFYCYNYALIPQQLCSLFIMS